MADFMFDNAFKRSRLYFQTLQLLRVFSDSILDTGRDIHMLDSMFLDPETARDMFRMPQNAPFGRSALSQELADLKKNWEFVTKFHSEAEVRLVQRVHAKIAEIQGIRDGVGLSTRHHHQQVLSRFGQSQLTRKNASRAL
jgi:hypothetical protein